MSLHLIKLCVGIDSVSHLAEVQARRLEAARRRGEPARLSHFTRNTPRRSQALLDGGFLYWVIRGFVRVRQRLIAIEPAVNDQGVPRCALIYDPRHTRTEWRPHRPFQGWRYLKADDAPPDARAGAGDADHLPTEMVIELRELGLL